MRAACESLVKSAGWDQLLNSLEEGEKEIVERAFNGGLSENEGLTSAYLKGYYQALEQIKQLPNELIEYAKSQEEETEEENNG